LRCLAYEGVSAGAKPIRGVWLCCGFGAQLPISPNHMRSVKRALVEESGGSVYFTTRF
jgi:hypothetical protein